MSPQFVDMNADGHVDLVAGIFDGSPHVSFGSAKGFNAPQQILDKDGARIVMNQFWNFDKKEWDSTQRCNPPGTNLKDGHLTSAWAFDWDGDGDLDLLLGDHSESLVMLRLNEGTAAKPVFATRNVIVEANGQPLLVAGTVATLRTFDWNRDGREDLVVGSMGEAFSSEGGGAAVSVWLNHGDGKQPKFTQPLVLVASSEGKSHGPEGPQSGMHMDLFDHDGDGDFDLIVGGYSHWMPTAPELTEAQEARVVELNAAAEAIDVELKELFARLDKTTEGLEKDAAAKVRDEAFKAEYPAIQERRKSVSEELQKLVPSAVRRSHVWLYENTAARPAAAGAGPR